MAEINFNVKIRGYDIKEVDEYIEKVHKEYSEVCAYLQEKAKSLEASLGNQEDIANAMVRAQSVLRQVEEEGKINAGKIVSEAEAKALSITSLAEIEADRIVNEAIESQNEIRNNMQQIFNIASLFLKETDENRNIESEDVSPLESETYEN